MALQTSGPISLGDVNGEFGGGAPISLGACYSGGARVPGGTTGANGPIPSSGTISLWHFYGSQSKIILNLIIPSNTTDYNIASAVTAALGYTPVLPLDVNITVGSGVVVSASSTATPAIISGLLPAGSLINLTNNGIIVGKGGVGGNPANPYTTGSGCAPGGLTAGSNGGAAIKVSVNCNITNNGIIGGGGGGGGAGGSSNGKSGPQWGGRGGGGAGFGLMGTTGRAGDGATDGSATVGGSRGNWSGCCSSGYGGAGGSLGANGASGINNGCGASGGGAAGACTLDSIGFITWVVPGSRYGALL